MPITGLSLRETEDYISEYDDAETEADGATVWILGALNADLRAHCGDMSFTMQGEMRAAQRNVEAVRLGLRGFRNFINDAGEQISFKLADKPVTINRRTYDVVHDDVLAEIPVPVIAELAAKLLNLNTINELVKKKLSTLS